MNKITDEQKDEIIKQSIHLLGDAPCDTSAVKTLLRKLIEPEMTPAMWKVVVDEKFMMVFSNEPFEKSGVTSYGFLKEHLEGDSSFVSVNDVHWKFGKVLREKGMRQPHFGKDCPVDEKARVIVKTKEFSPKIELAKNIEWEHNGEPSKNIREFIEL